MRQAKMTRKRRLEACINANCELAKKVISGSLRDLNVKVNTFRYRHQCPEMRVGLLTRSRYHEEIAATYRAIAMYIIPSRLANRRHF